ncbi:ser/Thr protein phosphatase family [Plectosphaerella plurivora]|uniref:Ser/Thr protein phosphatase family n=1 Tax=Plectosphaerella plurivora TaxID=936078 RepID=A0A9P9AD84_9PEZI|nr:ser/Thr protein phosphatase family [Plectosphaerella plurivora]
MALAITPSLPTARYRRLLSLLLLAGALAFVITLYSQTGTPNILLAWTQKHKNQPPADGPMAVYHAESARPPLEGMPHVLAKLDRDLVPVPGNGRRLVIVGDVHGMIEPLNELLDKINYRRPTRRRDEDGAEGNEEGGDHLVFVGDMINKGPSSSAVVDLAMELGASAVRGNHEDRILLERASMAIVRAGDDDSVPAPVIDKDDQRVLSSPAQRGNPADRACARSLSDAQAEWLAALPAILDLGFLPGCFPGTGRTIVAHAGLVPGITPLSAQDPWAVMNMRSLSYPREELRREEAIDALVEAAAVKFRISEEYLSDKDHWTNRRIRKKLRSDLSEADIEAEFLRRTKPSDRDIAVPSDGHGGVPWTDAWDAAQLAVEPDSRRTAVVYGHDSKAGFRDRPFSLGLDSGCVKGKELTALVVEANADGVSRRIVSVKCSKPKPAGKSLFGEGGDDEEDRP